MAKEYDHKKYGSVMKGRSAEQLASYNRDISPKHKALEAKKGMTKLHVEDGGNGNVTHLAKTTKRGVARFGKGQGHSGISHWSKEK